MESYNYKRAYSLVVGLPPSTIPFGPLTLEQHLEFTTTYDSEVDYRSVETAEAVEIQDLQMRAVIKGSDTKSVGESTAATISVFNLSEEQIAKVSVIDAFVILRAGYEFQLGEKRNYDSLPLIFTGQVMTSETKFMGVDKVTTLTCKEGFTPASSAKVSLSIKSAELNQIPQTYTEVFNLLIDVWKANGVSVADYSIDYSRPMPKRSVPIGEAQIPFGWSYEGFLSDAMDDACKPFGYTWYIANNILFIHSVEYKNFQKRFTLEENQTIDIKRNDDKSRGTSPSPNVSRIVVKTLLDGRVERGSKLEIPFGKLKGLYSVNTISYELDYRGQNWYNETTCEVI
tara:strand:+ start:1347 stop:2372 length:1026 start_codon:yes stop_codon:yes gene_type:complete